MIFLSGPVSVYPLETITFKAQLSGQGIGNAKWWKIKDQSKKELKIDKQKYRMNFQMNNIVCFEIYWADIEDSAAYQLSLGSEKSNRIYVHVDGKYIYLLVSCECVRNIFLSLLST